MNLFVKNRSIKLKYVQLIYSKLFSHILRSMNYGYGYDFMESGEINLLYKLENKFKALKNITLFDIGANTGDYSKEVIKIFSGLNYKLYAFEPSRNTFSSLINNVDNNSNFFPFNIGFDKTVNSSHLYTTDKESGLSSLFKRNLGFAGLELDKVEKVYLTTIDKFCEENKINMIDFMKLDIEGNEFFALKGAENMLKTKRIKYIQFEFGGCNIDSRTFFKDFYYLLSDNYNLYRILKKGLYPIACYKETLEIFVTTNYLAEIKD